MDIDKIKKEFKTRESLGLSLWSLECNFYIQQLIDSAYGIGVDNGFWEEATDSFHEKCSRLAHIHSEVSEALEALRKPEMKGHLEEIPLFDEELADIIIRVFDLAGRYNINLGEVILKKMAFNKTRGYKHGKAN